MQQAIPPSSEDDAFALFVERLRQRGPTLPKRLRQVADHLLATPDDVAFQTTAEIAERAGVQPSTLVRFAQALGYTGFSDLQQGFRARLRRQSSDHIARLAALRQRDREEGGSTRALLAGFIAAGEASLGDLRTTCDPDRIDQAAATLAAARLIVLVGARRMFPVVSYLAYAFARLGIPAVLIDNLGALGPEQADIATAADAVIAVSFAPYTPVTVDIAEKAHQRGVPVIALTDSALSPLAAACTHAIEVRETDFGAFRSMAATFALAMTLAVATAGKRRSDA